MYIGNVQAAGLHLTLYSLVAIAIDEARSGFGSAVRVTLKDDGSVEVSDDGRGLPVWGAVSLEGAFSQQHVPHPHRFHLVDYVTVNALSEWLRVETRYQGRAYRHEFRRGKPSVPPTEIGSASGSGLTITWLPDSEIFADIQFDAGTIKDRLREYAFLYSGVHISFADRVGGTEEHFEFVDGIRAYVQLLNEQNHPLHPEVLSIRGDVEGIRYELGFQWCQEDEIAIRSYVNGECVPNGGTHVSGFQMGVTRALNNFIHNRMPHVQPFKRDAARRGLVAVVSVHMREPQFCGALKTSLNNPEVEHILEEAVQNYLNGYLQANPAVAEQIVRAALLDMEAQAAAKKARDALRKQS
jgi:DNA gyrase subunit B